MTSRIHSSEGLTALLEQPALPGAGSRAIVTVMGTDRPGIVAGVSSAIAEVGANIEDISQTVMQQFFTMIMLVDFSKCKGGFSGLKKKLNVTAKEMNLQIFAQHEEVFQQMHRI